MCFWKSDYFLQCGHQPVYLLETCPRRKVLLDSYTDRCVVRACAEMEIMSVDNINSPCYDCMPECAVPDSRCCGE